MESMVLLNFKVFYTDVLGKYKIIIEVTTWKIDL
jgi:hypothetical protein